MSYKCRFVFLGITEYSIILETVLPFPPTSSTAFNFCHCCDDMKQSPDCPVVWHHKEQFFEVSLFDPFLGESGDHHILEHFREIGFTVLRFGEPQVVTPQSSPSPKGAE